MVGDVENFKEDNENCQQCVSVHHSSRNPPSYFIFMSCHKSKQTIEVNIKNWYGVIK